MPLPPIATPTLLSSLRTHPHLPSHTWYFIAGVTLSVLNRPEEIPTVFRYALDTGAGAHPSPAPPPHAEQLVIARKLREALVKAAPIGGLPKVTPPLLPLPAINALLSLSRHTPPQLSDPPLTPSPTLRSTELSSVPPSQILHRGQRFFDRVYGKVSARVMGQMDRCGTEDLGVTARLMYGYLLSNERVLSAVETSWVLMAGLVPQDVNPQLKGHLKGAVNNGATVEEVHAVREVIIKICEQSGMRRLREEEPGGWGWRTDVAKL
ncbi:MAG: hypothetical protein M1833_004474 [Piccolia ochrophora]|nr:MAG: hypothetical protein M1833_004474 [Piccolia ochrophora]